MIDVMGTCFVPERKVSAQNVTVLTDLCPNSKSKTLAYIKILKT